MRKDKLNSSLESLEILADAIYVLAEKFLFMREGIKLSRTDMHSLKAAAEFIEAAERGEKVFLKIEKDCDEDRILAYLLYRQAIFGLERREKITPPTISELKSVIAEMITEMKDGFFAGFFADDEIERVKLFFSYLAKGMPS